MIQPISAPISGGAAAGVKSPPEVWRPDSGTSGRPRRPAMDEYVPSEKQEPTGRYWLGRDEDGQPKIYFDDPEKKPDADRAERCICSTDRVDREIEHLKQRREELEQQIAAQTDDAKIEALEQKLAGVERELGQKDNDAYRRQHAVFS